MALLWKITGQDGIWVWAVLWGPREASHGICGASKEEAIERWKAEAARCHDADEELFIEEDGVPSPSVTL